MIYYSKEYLPILQHNMMVLDMVDGSGVLYVTSNTYDQAVILSHKYNGSLTEVIDMLGIDNIHKDIVEYLYSTLPTPINILSPFLNEINFELDINNIEELINVISYMSSIVSFSVISEVPKTLRTSIPFSKTAIRSAKAISDEFFKNAVLITSSKKQESKEDSTPKTTLKSTSTPKSSNTTGEINLADIEYEIISSDSEPPKKDEPKKTPPPVRPMPTPMGEKAPDASKPFYQSSARTTGTVDKKSEAAAIDSVLNAFSGITNNRV